MEKITYLPNGQWKLEKGVKQRLAPKPEGSHITDNSEAYELADMKSIPFRSQMHILKQFQESNPHSVKRIGDKVHVLLHRGIDPEADTTRLRSPMKVHEDKSLEHNENGMYTNDYNYASQWTNKDFNGIPHSVWVPLSNIEASANYVGDLGRNQLSAENPDIDMDHIEDAGFSTKRYTDHIIVKPGKYQHASKEDLEAFNNYNK